MSIRNEHGCFWYRAMPRNKTEQDWSSLVIYKIWGLMIELEKVPISSYSYIYGFTYQTNLNLFFKN